MTRPDGVVATPEIWGGVECSVTRLGKTWRDQLRETGHHDRPEDLERIAELGIRVLRYPFLWERLHDDPEGWAWQDERMAQLRRLEMQPVAGLLHHGSGPPGTDLLDPEFPEALARHAARVAERYPDIVRWVPVNEPLTTGRFSCLYGVWFPHLRDMPAFLRATAAQCHAVLLAMRAIRARISHAELIQTEDLGRTFATPLLQDQAQHENERRWLSLDLLCGLVDRAHPWRRPLEEAGVSKHHLDELASGEAAPDAIGANHYVTSERFLDHRTALYPGPLRGGNGRTSYVDTEAVRMRMPPGSTGFLPRMRELWARYRLPIVLSEVQLGGADPDEQLRWFMEAWEAALQLRSEGAAVPAVTSWAMVGSIDWDSLMQHQRGVYEAGVWDLAGTPAVRRPTADALQCLAAGVTFDHPALQVPGWWRREDRFHAIRQRA